MTYPRIAFPLLLAACTHAAVDSGADPGALEISPTGPDSTRATFIARGPTGSGVLASTEIELNGTGPAFGLDEVREVRVGPFRYAGGTIGSGLGGSTYFEGTLDAEVGKQTVLVFGGVTMRTVGPKTVGLERSVSSELVAPGIRPGVARSDLVLIPGVGDGTVVPVLPGTYRFRWGINDGADVYVTEGRTAVLDPFSVAQRETARIEPGARTKPNACSTNGWLTWWNGDLRSWDLPFSEPFVIGRNPNNAAVPVEYRLPCSSQHAPVEYSRLGAPTKTTKLGRVDVNDVTVTLADGTTERRHGSYRIFQGDEHIAGPFPTETGFDLLPGTYRVVVEYRTSAGNLVDYEQTFTTP